MYYMGFTYREAYDLPIWQRKWFIDRIQQEITNTQNSRAATDNSADQRALRGVHRQNAVPAKLRRFT